MLKELIELLDILKMAQKDSSLIMSTDNYKKKIFALETAIEVLKQNRKD